MLLINSDMQNDWLEKLSSDLNLERHSQDWGICNADTQRIDEFLSYYESNQKIHDWEPEALAELIYQSAEEALEENREDEELKEKIRRFTRGHFQEFPMTFNYWKALEPDDWCIPVILNEK